MVKEYSFYNDNIEYLTYLIQVKPRYSLNGFIYTFIGHITSFMVNNNIEIKSIPKIYFVKNVVPSQIILNINNVNYTFRFDNKVVCLNNIDDQFSIDITNHINLLFNKINYHNIISPLPNDESKINFV